MEVLQDQNAHHDSGRGYGGRPPLVPPPGEQFIDEPRQAGEVDVPGNDLQWIAQGLDPVLARCVGKEVELDGAEGLGLAHQVNVALAGTVPVERWGFLEVPF